MVVMPLALIAEARGQDGRQPTLIHCRELQCKMTNHMMHYTTCHCATCSNGVSSYHCMLARVALRRPQAEEQRQ